MFTTSYTWSKFIDTSNWTKNFDMNFFRVFRFAERFKLEYRIEAFNVFNHPQFTGVPGRNVVSSPAGQFLMTTCSTAAEGR
jgi:hypothetical protein